MRLLVVEDQEDCAFVLLIAISGFQSENDFMRSRAAGIDHHLPKPNYFERLSEILQGRSH